MSSFSLQGWMWDPNTTLLGGSRGPGGHVPSRRSQCGFEELEVGHCPSERLPEAFPAQLLPLCEPEALHAHVPVTSHRPCAGTRPVVPVVAALPCVCVRTPTVAVPQGDRPVVRGQRRLGGEAAALAAPEPAPLQRPLRPPQGLVPEGPGVPQPGGAFLPGRRVPEALQDAQGRLHRRVEGVASDLARGPSWRCSRPPSLPDRGSAGPRPGIPPPRRGGPAPRPAPTADPRRPVPHLLHQRPLRLLPPASPQEGVCGPHELSSCCRPPQGEGPPGPTLSPRAAPKSSPRRLPVCVPSAVDDA